MENLQAEAATWQITSLRQEALALCHDPSEEAEVRKLLHEPTAALRRGETIDTAEFLKSVQQKLGTRRNT